MGDVFRSAAREVCERQDILGVMSVDYLKINECVVAVSSECQRSWPDDTRLGLHLSNVAHFVMPGLCLIKRMAPGAALESGPKGDKDSRGQMTFN